MTHREVQNLKDGKRHVCKYQKQDDVAISYKAYFRTRIIREKEGHFIVTKD